MQQEPHPRSNMMFDMPCMIGRQCMEEKVCDCPLKGHFAMRRFFVVCTTYTFHSSFASHLCSHSGTTTGTTGTVQSLIRRSSPCVAETSELFLCLLVSASFHTVLSRSLTQYHSVHSVRLLFDQISCALCPALTYQKNQKRILFECASFFSGINHD